MSIKLSDFGKMTIEERRLALDSLDPNEGIRNIQQSIVALEAKYGMSSEKMQEAFDSGVLAEDADGDIARWLMRLTVLGKRPSYF